MTFNDNAQLDTSQIEARGSSGGGGGMGGGGSFPGGIQVGGGLGGLILLVLMLIFGKGMLGGGTVDTSTQPGDTRILQPSQVSGGGTVSDSSISRCKTGADANRDDACLVVATVNSVQDFWKTALPSYGMNYKMAKTVLYSGVTQSACGTASNQVGPFYCPLDSKVYIDASFFKLLSQRFGADGGQLAKEYVVAHEYGHHIQNLLGVLNRAQQDPQGPESGAVRIELMADCFAGVWVNHASTTKDASGTTLLKPITQQDINSALSAAAAVGDDQIQEKTQGRVTPENWTHGSSAMREKWFTTGYKSGDAQKCNTLTATQLD